MRASPLHPHGKVRSSPGIPSRASKRVTLLPEFAARDLKRGHDAGRDHVDDEFFIVHRNAAYRHVPGVVQHASFKIGDVVLPVRAKRLDQRVYRQRQGSRLTSADQSPLLLAHLKLRRGVEIWCFCNGVPLSGLFISRLGGALTFSQSFQSVLKCPSFLPLDQLASDHDRFLLSTSSDAFKFDAYDNAAWRDGPSDFGQHTHEKIDSDRCAAKSRRYIELCRIQIAINLQLLLVAKWYINRTAEVLPALRPIYFGDFQPTRFFRSYGEKSKPLSRCLFKRKIECNIARNKGQRCLAERPYALCPAAFAFFGVETGAPVQEQSEKAETASNAPANPVLGFNRQDFCFPGWLATLDGKQPKLGVHPSRQCQSVHSITGPSRRHYVRAAAYLGASV